MICVGACLVLRNKGFMPLSLQYGLPTCLHMSQNIVGRWQYVYFVSLHENQEHSPESLVLTHNTDIKRPHEVKEWVETSLPPTVPSWCDYYYDMSYL